MIHEDYYEFKKFEHELVLETCEKIKQSKDPIVIESLKQIKPSEYFYHIKLYIDVLKNYIYLKDEKILKKYLAWRYRVYYYRSVEMDFFLIENSFIQELSAFYFSETTYIRLSTMFQFVKDTHKDRLNELLDEKEIKYKKDLDQMYQMALLGDKNRFYNLCKDKITNEIEFCNFMDDVLTHLFTRIGYEWESTNITIAQEHIATNTLSLVIDSILNSFKTNNSKNISVLVTCAPKENHGVGVHIGIKLLELLGINVINVGNNLAIKDLETIIYEQKPDYVIFSMTLLSYLDEVDLLIKKLKSQDPHLFVKFILVGHSLSLISKKSTLYADYLIEDFTSFYTLFLEK